MMYEEGEANLNFGCFQQTFPRPWLNMDKLDLAGRIKYTDHAFMQLDVLSGLPFEDNTIEKIYHSHMLEHFNITDGLYFLEECHRIMKDDAVMRISVPDISVLYEKYVTRNMSEFNTTMPNIFEQMDDDMVKLGLIMFGSSGEDCRGEQYAGHRMIYNYTSLKYLLERVGFKEVKRSVFNDEESDVVKSGAYDVCEDHSLIVEVRKGVEGLDA